MKSRALKFFCKRSERSKKQRVAEYPLIFSIPIASLSSTYMLIYALGQLVNGVIGDKIKPKYMVAIGLSVAGTVSVIFSFTENALVQTLLFAILGFSLSMLRGPLVKTISENMAQKYARVCCVFLTVVSSVGPLIASLLALIFKWNTVFIVAGFACIIMSIFSFIALSVFEQKGLISPLVTEKEKSGKNPLEVFKLDNFIYFMIIGALVAVSVASSLLWSIYIPSQAKSGLTSTVNGVLDFSGYFTASIVNRLSANVVATFDWSGVIIMWTGLMSIGIIASFFTKNKTLSD